jgi:hypothetical protein
MKRPGRKVCLVGGVKFLSTGDGHYKSEGGKYGIYHMLQGTVQAQWELYRSAGDNPFEEMIDYGLRLGDLTAHAKRGDFRLDED